MKASEFDQRFDDGESILETLDLSQAKRIMQEQAPINIDFPIWMLESLEREAKRIGVTKQSMIKVWLAERLETIATNHALRIVRVWCMMLWSESEFSGCQNLDSQD